MAEIRSAYGTGYRNFRTLEKVLILEGLHKAVQSKLETAARKNLNPKPQQKPHHKKNWKGVR